MRGNSGMENPLGKKKNRKELDKLEKDCISSIWCKRKEKAWCLETEEEMFGIINMVSASRGEESTCR